MKIEFWQPASLKVHPALAGVHALTDSDADFARIVTSIREHGLLEPLKVTAGGLVVDGRHRLRAARKLKLDELPCVLVDDAKATEVALATLSDRRHLASKGQLAYAAYPLFAAAHTALLVRLAARLASGKPDSAPERVVDFATQIGVSRDEFLRAAKLHEIFGQEPALKAEWEPQIMAREKPIGLGQAIAGIAGQRATKGAKRPPPRNSSLSRWICSWGHLAKEAKAWQRWTVDDRDAAAEALASSVSTLPDELLDVLRDALRAARRARDHGKDCGCDRGQPRHGAMNRLSHITPTAEGAGSAHPETSALLSSPGTRGALSLDQFSGAAEPVTDALQCPPDGDDAAPVSISRAAAHPQSLQPASRECPNEAGCNDSPSSAPSSDSAGLDNHGVTAAAREASPRYTAAQFGEAQRRYRMVEMYVALIGAGSKPAAAAAALRSQGHDVSRSSLDRWARAIVGRGFHGLIDGRYRSGRPRSALNLTPEQLARVRARVLATTNRTADSGSVPEALRQAVRRGELPAGIGAVIADRERDGRGIPDALRRELIPAPAAVRQLRGPTDAGLDYLSSPGSLMWIKDSATGTERFARVGDVLEADDVTVNFLVCVPWEIGGCPCSERWGVKIGRFQWLVAIDRASRFIPGWTYTMRPRDSYRAEDILALFHGIFSQHGVWQRLCLEQGVWKAGAVSSLLEQLGVERMTAWSPHQKPFIEGVFSSLHSKLADLPGQVGRSRGEEEATERLARSCRTGATDPRQHFPMLSQVLAAMARVCSERGTQPIHSDLYGSWVPEERWLSQLAEAREGRRLRSLPAGAEWMFAPEAREWTVQGGLVGGSIQVMDGLSVRYDFAAEWLTQFDGARVRAHFNPSAPTAEATLVLQSNMRDHSAGEVLGTAVQVNKVARYARRVLGWGDDPDIGRDMRKIQAQAMRREVRAILPGGETGLSVTDLRDGLGRAATVEQATPTRSPNSAPTSPPRRGENPFSPAAPDEFAKRSSRNSRLLAATLIDDD